MFERAWLPLVAYTLLITTVAAADPAEVHSLLKLEATQNEKCRGGSGDDPATQSACDARDITVRRLNSLGYCYGKVGQYGYQMSWHRCGPSSLKSAD